MNSLKVSPRHVKSDEDKKDKAENAKLFFEFNKHLTTLSSGSILVILTLGEKFTSDHHFTVGMSKAVISFVISIIGAFMVMGTLSFCADGSTLGKRDSIFLSISFVLSAGGFIGGMVRLALQMATMAS